MKFRDKLPTFNDDRDYPRPSYNGRNTGWIAAREGGVVVHH